MNSADSASAQATFSVSAPPSAANSYQLKRGWELLLLAGLLIYAFFGGFFHISDVDVGYHIRTGAYVLEHHRIPATNTFSSAVPEQQWLLHQWWPATFYHLVYRSFGANGLITVKACIGAFLMFLVFCCARRAGGGDALWTFWLVTVGLIIARVRFFERPDLISAVIFAGVLYLDSRWARNRKWQWLALPLVMAFWANTHGGVAYGFVLLGVFAAAEWAEAFHENWKTSRRLTLNRTQLKELIVRPIAILISIAAALIALTLVNPNGAKVILVPITQFASPFWQSMVVEYFSPTWTNAKLFYISLAGLVLLQAFTWRQLQWRWLFLGAAFGYLACSSQRSIMYYTIVAVPYAAFLVSKLPALSVRFRRWQGILLPVSWAALVVLLFVPNHSLRFGYGFYPPHYPLEIYRFIEREVPPQNIFNEARYGGGMLWWLYPRFKPFIDMRGDAYTPEFWQEIYLPIYRAQPGWRDSLKKYDLHAVWLPIFPGRVICDLGHALFADPQWAVVAFNDHSVLFLERTELNRDLIAQHEFRYISPADLSFSKITPATLKDAAAEADRALARSPDSVTARTAAARTKMMLGDFPSAVVLYAALVEAGHAAETYWRDYGYCLYMGGQHDAADAVFTKMIQQHMLVPYAWYMRHWVAVQKRQWPEAKAFLAKALELEPASQEYQQARQRLEAALKPTPSQQQL